ncbi:hypothetical protein [Mycolicibacterium thermoresistibile]
MTSTTTADTLSSAAFGEEPGRWPLPTAVTPHERWLRAVAAGGQGRYGAAMVDLDELRRTSTNAVHRSLAHSTYASFLRQLGGHARARGWDGRAWAEAGDHPDAAADALVGLAADALGLGRFRLAQRLLERAAVPVAQGTDRLRVRLGWVSAELAMARGAADAAVSHAEQAVEVAATYGSARHRVKSAVVLAAALCSAGDVDRSRRVADAALVDTERYGLIPLRWALCCLLADIGSSALSSERVVAVREECADTVRRRGGVWTAC